MDESRFIGDKFIVSIEKKNGIFYEFHTLKLYDHSKSFIDLMNKLKNSLILNSSTENQHASGIRSCQIGAFLCLFDRILWC